ncbi:class A beta-lactamase [Polaromonas sp.]|uniref:class A beta-lactamase n=1 Tax=Polaromonas sp. TaxID=1869339 RepID=UPI002489922B|nr:class A beta-lactamase [Polaromonas sp.]MDI1273860.1 class A beta-lactamase [Polaromonas sp.]
MHRRQLIQAAGLAATTLLASGCARSLGAPVNAAQASRFEQALRQIESASAGRLGAAMLDTHSGASYAYRGAERFPMCSTFKFLAAAQVLSRVDQGQEQLDRRITVRASDIIQHSPATKPRVGGLPMTLAELCEATITLSDNAAANLMLKEMGGPPGLTAYMRSLGDDITRLDRIAPELNESTPGDPRDTTTPQAMLQSMQKILLGTALSTASRAQITRWLLDNKTGDRKLRALLPAGWRVGDKTGGGAYGSNNDIGIFWPPGRAPILVTAYLTQTQAEPPIRDRAIVQVGQLVATLVSSSG